jgi:hypothetical protein
MCSVGLWDVNMPYQSVWLLYTGQSYPCPSWVIVPSVSAASSASSPSECPSRSCACRCLEAASPSSGMWWDVSVMYSHNIHLNLIEYFFPLSLKYWIECLVLLIHTQKIRVWFLVHVPFIQMNFFFSPQFVCLFVLSSLSPLLNQGKFYNTPFRQQWSPLWSSRLMLCLVCISKGISDSYRKKV